MAKKRGLGGLGGSPRTRHAGSLDQYRPGLLPEWLDPYMLSIAGIGYRPDQNVTSEPYWNVMRPGEGRVDPNVEYPMTPDWLPPGMRQRMLPPPAPFGLGNPEPVYRSAPRNWRKNPKRRNWRDIET